MFWTRFIKLCNEAGKSPNAVAADCGVKSSGTVTGWRNGSIPRTPVLHKMADYFNVTADYLLGNVDLPFLSKDERDVLDIDLSALAETKKPTPEAGSGQDDEVLEREFMRWFRAQPPERQKDVLFDLARVVSEHGE